MRQWYFVLSGVGFYAGMFAVSTLAAAAGALRVGTRAGALLRLLGESLLSRVCVGIGYLRGTIGGLLS
jgi:hypothetical protein